jgi:hypothetical protein
LQRGNDLWVVVNSPDKLRISGLQDLAVPVQQRNVAVEQLAHAPHKAAEPLMWNKYERADDRARTLDEHARLLDALAAHDRARCIGEMERHRYSAEFGVPIELPGAGPDLPAGARVQGAS